MHAIVRNSMANIPGYRKSAALSPDGRYRWWLRRQWHGGNNQVVCFIMLNPSTADASVDDPTIRRCVGFARDWGYSTLSVRNLFPYRATHPKDLLIALDPAGGDRGENELLAGLTAHLTVLAWGAFVPFERQAKVLYLFRSVFRGKLLYCLGLTKKEFPRHPLYVRKTQQLILYR